MLEQNNNQTLDFDFKSKENINIDYNYPSLNRKDLSDLSKINDKNHHFKKLNTNRDWSLNLYNLDIEGSSPRKFGYFIHKEDFTNKNSDIEKSSPKNYYENINKKSFNLTNDDIEFSKPHCVKNETTRHVNPLEPKYNLPNPPIYPVTPPKFIRDSMDINDIKGARPKKIGNEKNLFKEPIKKEVVKDSWPRKPYLRKNKYEYMDYRDITKKILNNRNTNPLRPIYNWKYADNTKSFGPIEGNSPSVYSKFLYKMPFNLNNYDIEGSNVGSKNHILKFNGSNCSYSTLDIRGAQGDTVMRGIITKRHIDPLAPKYEYLGHSEISSINNNPYNTGFNSAGHFDKKNLNMKINFSSSNINNNINTIKNSNNNSIEDNTSHNGNNKILEKNIKIVDDKKDQKKNKYEVPLRSDGKPDFGNFPVFNSNVEFDKEKYKKPQIFYGIPHYKYLIPSDMATKKVNTNKFEKLKIPIKPLNNKEMKRRSASTSTLSKESNNYYSKLDDFMNSRNLKYIENKEINNNLNNIKINSSHNNESIDNNENIEKVEN